MSARRPPPPGAPGDAGETPEARVHPIEWSPWIWVLPALAILAVGWFVVRYAVFGGGEITVRFVEARGLDRYSPVRYRGAKVGTVQEINIDEDLAQVVVRISMDAGMRDALREGTSFWIVEPDLSGGLGSLLTGTYIGISPGPGEPTRVFQGREHPPILAAPEPGRIFLLEAQGLGTATIGSPVDFRGMRVGRVLGAEYDHRRGITTVHVFVLEPFAVYVRETTRFWRAGGFELGLEGGKLSLGDLSLGSLLTPAFSFYTPEVLFGEQMPEGARFELFETEAAAIADSGGPHLPYRVSFSRPLDGLGTGTPVTLRGVQVGRVREVRLRYLPESGTLETPAIVVIDPRELGIPVPAGTTREELRASLDAAMARLVEGGLRATLATSLILPGASAVSLERVGAPGTARLDLSTDPPTIPAAGGGGGLAGALAAVERVAATIEDLPLREIAGDLRSAARRVDALVHDPRLDAGLGRFDAAMADVESAARTARQSVDPIAESLRNAADDVEATAALARENVDPIAESLRRAAADVESAAATIEGAAGTAAASVEPIAESLRRAAASVESAAAGAEGLLGAAPGQGYDLAALVEELTRAAASVRALATYLTEHPEALVRGRAP